MEDKIVKILNEMSEYLSITQMKKLQEVILKTFSENTASKVEIPNEDFLKMFLDAKKIEGCSDRTLQYYKVTVEHLLSQIKTFVRKITTEEIRAYLADYQKNSKCSNVTIDNIRRNISSFFSWLEEEDYILKSPMRRIHKIRTKTVVKSVITDEGIEKLRDNCMEIRDLAIIDLLYSTIKQVLNILMTDGIKIDYGQKLGKTIIFAKNHDHAEKIREVFNKEYPHLPDYAKVIDNYMTYAQSAIDEFSDSKKMPQIAISVDMLDTGIDVPEVLNLVFFKKVMSKAKFWQMIGRGTRLCPGLLDGEDKQKFYIFDFCGNFEFFRMNKGKATANMIALQGAIFNLKFEISYKLQDMEYQIDRLIEYRKALVKQMSEKVRELPRDNFAVRQHLKYVDLYSSESNYNALTYEDTLIVREEVAPLILPDGDEASAVRFDALMYGIELAYLVGKKYSRARTDLRKKVAGIANVANIPEIQAQSELVNKILNTDYVDNAGINEFEEIREKLRDLMKYIPKGTIKYVTNFTDELLSMEWKESELENDELKNYKAKAEYYIRQHQDNIAIAKLKTNRPLTSGDLASLEEILWREVGTKQDYEHEFGSKPLGEFVREIVGLDMNAAKEAFSEYLTGTNLDSRQIYFVNQIVEYIVHNGMMKDLSVLLESPFTDRGSVAEVFTDLNVWLGIRKVIDTINANAAA